MVLEKLDSHMQKNKVEDSPYTTEGSEVKVAQSCPTLCDPMVYIVHGILQARILEWVAFPFSRGSSQPRDRTQVSALQADSLPAEPPGKPREPRGQRKISSWQRIPSSVPISLHPGQWEECYAFLYGKRAIKRESDNWICKQKVFRKECTKINNL